jgi:phage gp29-like protein
MVMHKLRAALGRILNTSGGIVDTGRLAEPQTATMIGLHQEWQGHPTRGLTPSKLASIMDAAEQGDLAAQSDLFEDMEEKDGHIMSEIGKRRRALLGLDWDIVPPNNPSATERKAAEALYEHLQGLDDFEGMLFDVTDGIGKGFANLELEWGRDDGIWLPASIEHRPQSWFTVVRGYRQEIRLRGPGGGEPLQPFGWITHQHKAKSGYLERSALFRVLAWPFLFKNYSVGDLAEFLEIYGIPMRLGKYPSGSSEKDKLTLLRALSQLGHRASGIIPSGMELDFLDAATGDPKAFELMISWCERTQSKAILGGTLTSQADGASSTNALGNVHNEVRMDLRDADARQIASTLSRDLIYPIALLNGWVSDWKRCPRLRFDISEPEDLTAYADSLPKLAGIGLRIPRQWAQERLAIPEPAEGEEILQAVPVAATPGAQQPLQAAATAQRPADTSAALAKVMRPATDQWIDQIRALVDDAESLEQIRDGLTELLPDMTLDQYAEAMSHALAAAALRGRYDVLQEAAGGNNG